MKLAQATYRTLYTLNSLLPNTEITRGRQGSSRSCLFGLFGLISFHLIFHHDAGPLSLLSAPLRLLSVLLLFSSLPLTLLSFRFSSVSFCILLFIINIPCHHSSRSRLSSSCPPHADSPLLVSPCLLPSYSPPLIPGRLTTTLATPGIPPAFFCSLSLSLSLSLFYTPHTHNAFFKRRRIPPGSPEPAAVNHPMETMA